MKIDTIDAYWHSFLAKLPVHSNYHYKPYAAEQFGHSPELADVLGGLILSGAKTGTCSSLWEWEAEGKMIPQPGLITIVLNSRDEPLCIIEDTEVYVTRFRDVDDEFAEAEGEGDLSLDYWREAHTRYFSRILPKIGRDFREDMPVVCERFKVIYK
ncbi:MAG: ASCH domain-containing protein [Chloroflexota bacterium]